MAKKKHKKTKRPSAKKAAFPWLNVILCGIILLTTVLVYVNTVHYPFQFDDLHRIESNANIRSFSSVFTNYPFFKGNRTIVNLSLWFNYAIGSKDATGQPSVEGMHIFNILFHALNGILVYFLAVGILGEVAARLDPMKIEPSGPENSLNALTDRYATSLIAFFAALIFTLHPVQTESVTYLITRSEILAVFFSLAALLLYVKLVPSKSMLRFGVMTVSIAILYALGLESKEWVPVLPLLMVLVEFIFYAGGNGRKLWKRLEESGTAIFVVVVMTAIFLFNLSRTYRGDLDAGFNVRGISHGNYILSQFNVVAYYVKLLFVPTGLRLDYDFPVVTSLLSFPTILFPICLLLLLASGILTIRRSPVYSFAVLWFFITLLPSSGIIPIADLAFEHRLYVPMVGFSIFAAYMVWRIFQVHALRKVSFVSFVVLFALCIVSAVGSVQRNRVWSTPESLWADSAAKSPEKARPHANLGLRYYHMFLGGDRNPQLLEKAEQELRIAIGLKPEDFDSLHNLALVCAAKAENRIMPKQNLELARDMYGNAVSACEKMISETEKRLRTDAKYDNLLESAVEKQLSAFSSKLSMVYHDLAIAWEMNDAGERYGIGFDAGKAKETWDKAIKLSPDNPDLLWNKTIALVHGGVIDEGAEALKAYMAMTGNKAVVDIFYNNGISAFQKNDYRRARCYLGTALKIAPDNPKAAQARRILSQIGQN